MSESGKHTPGPWVVSGYDVVTAWFDLSGDDPPEIHHHVIVRDCNYSGWIDPDVPSANARLIAAAPDMLAALRDVAKAYAGLPDGYRPSWHTAALAAITKAEGSTPQP